MKRSLAASLALVAPIALVAVFTQGCWIGGALPDCVASSRLADTVLTFDDARSHESAIRTVIDRALSGAPKDHPTGFVSPATDDTGLEVALNANPRTWFENPACLTVAVQKGEGFVKNTVTFEGCRLPSSETVWSGNVISTWTRDGDALVVEHSTLNFTLSGRGIVNHRKLRYTMDAHGASIVSSVQSSQGTAQEQNFQDPYMVIWDTTSVFASAETPCAKTVGSARGRFTAGSREGRFDARWDGVRECTTPYAYEGAVTIVTGDEPREGAYAVFVEGTAGVLVSANGVDDSATTESCYAR